MTYKTILVEVGTDPGCRDRVRAAAALAARFGAHLAGLTPTGIRLGAVRGGIDDATHLAELERDRLRNQAFSFGGMMRDMVAEAGADISFSHDVIEDEAGRAFVLRGKSADLVVMAQRPPYGVAPLLVTDLPEQVLLGTGRPVIIVPQLPPPPLHGGHLVVAWDGGREAARAVADALPLLLHARHVTVVAAGDVSTAAHGDGAGLGALRTWLLRHGIVAGHHAVPPGHEPPADAILAAVEVVRADMLVAGCYGHSRVRELVMGGTTRSLLHRAPLPVMMSH
ncbi:Nucleotide-binding universal stress protein, UspA family [Cupriavidus sp. YR651]|uniref:universal stress protein n=1 Tax=Cupriavidus sp. YR651 TaxID=1855315 RepID=UPI00088CA293|nr:universal stress protein [Cupriavidus sp. YR651]SDD82741.1 Nucleotide-binding universal stress protein, UspA family [Cupriavidus sp. YR651]